MRRFTATSPHTAPVLLLCGLSLVYWSKVLFTGHVLLPGAFLRGFAPFGADPQAPWNILQWDALAQYYPWRAFAARQWQSGLIPLWNPHQFAGTPFLANGQSAVFYPLNLPFWLLDVAFAFGVSALLHTLLATLATYFLAQHWQLSRAASLLAAIAFGFCGYLTAWVMLPTLANTASWLPLSLLLLERATDKERESGGKGEWRNADQATLILSPILPFSHSPILAVALCCALLAGHVQIFFYLL
ncbi:MAG: YfhO family protein, partial [Armatimonadota bacterium]|nr:YfhO family protein [Armatimonadota bacterium]